MASTGHGRPGCPALSGLYWLPKVISNQCRVRALPHPSKATLSPHPSRGEGRVRGAVGHSTIGFISEIYFGNCSIARLPRTHSGELLASGKFNPGRILRPRDLRFESENRSYRGEQ